MLNSLQVVSLAGFFDPRIVDFGFFLLQVKNKLEINHGEKHA